jgi:hypothetical protein
MLARPDNHNRLFALVAVSVALVAYALARPDGIADTASRANTATNVINAAPAATATAAVPYLDVDSDDEEGSTESLDLPIDDQVDEGTGGNSSTADIPGNMTINEAGMPVPAGPPALSDHSITSEDEVPGAE